MTSHRRFWKLPALLAVLLSIVPLSSALASGTGTARARAAQACAGDPTPRNASNPLDLSQAPGANPLHGAGLFVSGPAHGAAAGAIASLLGLSPQSFSDSYSWAQFQQNLDHGPLSQRLARNRSLRFKVRMLEKIASQPEAQRFSAYSGGGSPAGIAAQVNKIFCQNHAADPRSILLVNTYFAHADVSGCSPAAVRAATPQFRRQIDAMAGATGNHRAVFLLEVDAIGTSACFAQSGSLGLWEGLLRYEVRKIGSLPHTLVYLEGGYADANGPVYTARVLNAVGIGGIRGFFTNDTHIDWTINEVRWAQKISRMTHGAHFIVNTDQNGNGPLWNKNRVRDGNEDLCNPPGRALGPRYTTQTGFRYADAFLWEHTPGASSGHCHGGPAGGVFWPARAISLASRANGRLGPGWPSHPY